VLIFVTAEFWSAIAGAIVGGLIAFGVQLIALRDAKVQREEDRRRTQQALGNSLLFKMIRIYSNFHGIRGHIEGCFEEAKKKGVKGEPWQIVLPLANPPDHVHFSSDEMGMLLAQKDDDIFNAVVEIDVIHNSLVDALKVMQTLRMNLADRLVAEEVAGNKVSGVIPVAEGIKLRPKMIEVNMLVDNVRALVAKDFDECGVALDRLQELLRRTLGLSYKLTKKV
jgi:hypothetical protein